MINKAIKRKHNTMKNTKDSDRADLRQHVLGPDPDPNFNIYLTMETFLSMSVKIFMNIRSAFPDK